MSKRKLGEPIAYGTEKTVYLDPIDPENKITAKIEPRREKNEEWTENQVKARYYYSKIAHLLFPNNIPDFHFSSLSDSEHVIRSEKMAMDRIHTKIQDIYNQSTTSYVSDEQWEKHDELAENRRGQEPVKRLVNKMKGAGLHVDFDGRNFAYNKKGAVQYLDNDPPWRIYQPERGKKQLGFYFDPELLKTAISHLPKKQEEQALKYFERLMILLQQDQLAIQ